MSDVPRAREPRNPFGRLIGLRIDSINAGVCHAHLEATPEHFNPNGVMHGGALFSLADTGMGAALFSVMEPQELCATIEIKMNFLRPVSEGRLDCVTSVLRRGRTTAVLESRVQLGESLVAVALGTYAIFPRHPAAT
jgi:uncharacterized protein (TIGR00369 family)